jgi:hypothetical protein
MCARVDNQQSHGVVIAMLQSSVQSLLHQRRDLHQSTYLYIVEDREPTSHQEAYDRSYSPHPPCGQGYHTEVDIRGRHE